ncbi:MAG: hypothetical protein AB1346_08245 [Thermodesulfobacteriota bacterium]
MNWKTALCCVAMASAIAVSPALADPQTPVVDGRQQIQQERIGQGTADGRLTPAETIRLERQQTGIQRTENRAKADGVVTPAERARLKHRQNRASRSIYRQKHDAQTAR